MLQRYGLLPLFTNKKTCFLTSVFGHSPFFSPFFVKIMLYPHVGITFFQIIQVVNVGAVEEHSRFGNLFTALRASEKQEKIRKYKKKALHVLYFFSYFLLFFLVFFKPPKA